MSYVIKQVYMHGISLLYVSRKAGYVTRTYIHTGLPPSSLKKEIIVRSRWVGMVGSRRRVLLLITPLFMYATRERRKTILSITHFKIQLSSAWKASTISSFSYVQFLWNDEPMLTDHNYSQSISAYSFFSFQFHRSKNNSFHRNMW